MATTDRDPLKRNAAGLTGIEMVRLRDLLRERDKRKAEGLNLWEPTPNQDHFHKCRSTYRIVRGGWRGGKAQPVDEPVLTPNGWTPIGALREGDVIIGGDGKPCVVTGVFPQGVKPVFRIRFDDGAETRCCEEHLWKVKVGRNYRAGKHRLDDAYRVMSLGELRRRYGDCPTKDRNRAAIPVCVPWMPTRETPVDPYLLGLLLGDGSLSGSGIGFTTGDAEMAAHVKAAAESLGCSLKQVGRYDYRLSGGRWAKKLLLLDRLRAVGVWRLRSYEKHIPHAYLFNTPEVRLAVLQGLMDTDGSIAADRDDSGQAIEFCTTSPQLAEDVTSLVRSLGGKCRVAWRVTSYTYKGERRTGRPSARLRITMRQCPFRLARKVERWKQRSHFTPNRILREITADGEAECVCISVSSPDHTYVTRDYIVTHNTLSCAVEFARAVTGQDPHQKYPTDRPLTCWIVCWDEGNIGRTIHRLLFRAGAFFMIKDEITGQWRTWREYDPADKAREKERKPAPPLIPPRLIAEWSWKEKSKRTFAVCRLTNGTEIYTFSSGGDPPTGDPCDIVWIDEDLQYEEHLQELKARLIDRGGKLFWSAKPRSRNDALMSLSRMAEDERNRENPTCAEFALAMSKNPHLPEQSKREALKGWTAEQQRLFDYGEFITDQVLVYPDFHIETHGVPQNVDAHGVPLVDQPWDIDRIIRQTGQIPHDWTRYAAIDPGVSVGAVVFCAVPPPELGDWVVAYDELYINNCTPQKFAAGMREKTAGVSFYAFIIDDHGSRVRTAVSAKTIRQQYTEALREVRVESETTGSGFVPGCDDVAGRRSLVRQAMQIRGDGTTRFRILRGKCPMLRHEVERLKKRIVNGVILDESMRMAQHACDCYDAATEVLTAEGWKYFQDLAMHDCLATVRLEDNAIEYQKPSRLIAKEYDGEMVRIASRKLDIVVTPTHRMVVSKGVQPDHIVPASDLTIWHRIKLQATWGGSGAKTIHIPAAGMAKAVDVDAGDFAAFMGWFVSEGSTDSRPKCPGSGYRVCISQKPGQKYEDIRALLRKLPWHWVPVENGFAASSKQLWEYLRPLGNKYTKHAPQWVKDASPEVIERFLDAAIAGDGWTCEGTRTYCTVSKRLADDMQELFLKAGRSANIRIRAPQPCLLHGAKYSNCVQQYHVTEWRTKGGLLRNSSNDSYVGRVHYSGMVYCATVPNGTLIVRRNGKPFICGNCLEYLFAYDGGQGPTYRKPLPSESNYSPAYRAFLAMQKELRRRTGPAAIELGPSHN